VSDDRIDRMTEDVSELKAQAAGTQARFGEYERNIAKFWETEWVQVTGAVKGHEERIRELEKIGATLSTVPAQLAELTAVLVESKANAEKLRALEGRVAVQDERQRAIEQKLWWYAGALGLLGVVFTLLGPRILALLGVAG